MARQEQEKEEKKGRFEGAFSLPIESDVADNKERATKGQILDTDNGVRADYTLRKRAVRKRLTGEEQNILDNYNGPFLDKDKSPLPYSYFKRKADEEFPDRDEEFRERHARMRMEENHYAWDVINKKRAKRQERQQKLMSWLSGNKEQ